MRLPKIHFTSVLLALTFAAQIALAVYLHPVQPAFDVLPPVPTPQALDASSFGDRQLLYRSLVLDLQNFGDTGGHWTPLKDYGMPKVVRWLDALDQLDLDAKHHMLLATRYFGQTQNKAELEPLIEYLSRHVAANPRGSWPYLADAIFLAQIRLKSREWVIKLADQMGSYDFPEMGPSAFEMPALMRYRTGDYSGAAKLMDEIAQRLGPRVDDNERAFIADFIANARSRPDDPNAPLVSYQ